MSVAQAAIFQQIDYRRFSLDMVPSDYSFFIYLFDLQEAWQT